MKIKVKITNKGKDQKAEVEGSPEVVAALLRGMADELAGKQTCSHYHYHSPYWNTYGSVLTTNSTAGYDNSYSIGSSAIKAVQT